MKLLASLLILSLACICLIYVGYRFGHSDGILESDAMAVVKFACVMNTLVVIEGNAYRVKCFQLNKGDIYE